MMKAPRVFIELCTALFLSPLMANEPPSRQAASSVLLQFCQSEFDGPEVNGVSDIRFDFIKYSTARAKIEKKRDPDSSGLVVYFDGTPLVVVATFRIESVRLHGKEALASVSYVRLASTHGNGQASRRFFKDPESAEIVNYHLLYTSGRWWILDPPMPRISRASLIKGYKQIINERDAGWFDLPDVTEAQKQLARKQADELKFLEDLSSEP